MAQDIDLGEVDLEVHVVASPLAGHPKLTARCKAYEPPGAPNSSRVKVFQWRTVKAQDGAFKKLEKDPQLVDIPGSEVTRLPEQWNGRRLGHNWSVSWVGQKLAGGLETPKSPAGK